MTLRRVRPDDLAEVYRLVEDMVRETPVDYPPPDMEMLAMATEEASRSPDFMGLVSDAGDGKLNGIAVYYRQPYLWAKALQCVLLFIYVEDGPDKGNISKAMFGIVEEDAKLSNCREISFTFSSGRREDLASRMLRTLGYEQIGVDFRKVL
jgi:hypothetical protein